MSVSRSRFMAGSERYRTASESESSSVEERDEEGFEWKEETSIQPFRDTAAMW